MMRMRNTAYTIAETISETTYREYPGEIDMDYMDIKDRNMNAQDMGVRE